eukprot:TRINITY_DN4474_c1_g1_i2.p1 TRINITY_DN4474_c1_g1~~TRINITY_DN4474_c1_g1_i2.p1  ORF type:complete len:586 (+),score=67.48 TRINITY_DN4474_c1_g1_i2:26-1759(+)
MNHKKRARSPSPHEPIFLDIENAVARLKTTKATLLHLPAATSPPKHQPEEAHDGGAPGTPLISFDEWTRMPNRYGVLGCTATPMKRLRAKLGKYTSGVVWIESPMGTGKTSLGQILQQFGTEYKCASHKQTNFKINTNSFVPLFIDEAQRLSFDGLMQVRDRSNNSVVFLAGTSCVEIPFACTDHCGTEAASVICQRCFKFQCCAPLCTAQEGHSWQSTVSTSTELAGRITVDELCFDDDEMAVFLRLYDKEPTHPHLPETTIPILKAITGGMLGLTMHVLVHLSSVYHQAENGTRIAFDATGLRLALWSQTMVDSLISNCPRTLRFACSLDELKALEALLRDGTQPAEKTAVRLCKKGILKKNGPGQDYLFRSYLHLQQMQWTLFAQRGHIGCPWDNAHQLVTHVLSNLNYGQLFLANGDMQHEDAVNRAIANTIIRSLPRDDCYYIGPGKARALGDYAQCDHVIYNHPSLGLVLLEVLLEGNKEHTQRLRKLSIYNARTAIVLDLRDNRQARRATQQVKAFDLRCAPTCRAFLFCADINTTQNKQLTFTVYIPVNTDIPTLGMKEAFTVTGTTSK